MTRVVTDAERRARIGVRHGLATPVADVEAATRAVVCLHATEIVNVYLSAFARCGASRDDVDRALYTDRTLARQLAMRRTVFAFPRDLVPAVRGSAAARVATMLTTRLAADLEFSGVAADGRAWIAEVNEQVREAVRAEPVTAMTLRSRVAALGARIRDRTPAAGPDMPVSGPLLTALAAGGSVVRGHNSAGWQVIRPYWTAIEQWLGQDPGVLAEADGYAELVRRWLWAFGPGTEDDIVWWLGATKTAVRAALAAVGAVGVELEDGRPAWMHPEDDAEVDAPAPWAALLPSLDPSTMGWKARDFHVGPHAARVYDATGNGRPTAWVDGRIVGGWAQDEDGRVVVVPFETLPDDAHRRLAARADELTAWLGGEIARTVYAVPR